jgi:hypothetical protein
MASWHSQTSTMTWPLTSWPRRLEEGLIDLAELTRLAGELARERLWGFVVDELDALGVGRGVCCGSPSGPAGPVGP